MLTYFDALLFSRHSGGRRCDLNSGTSCNIYGIVNVRTFPNLLLLIISSCGRQRVPAWQFNSDPFYHVSEFSHACSSDLWHDENSIRNFMVFILPAVALFILPESPRWLVTQGRLDEALAVIHQVYTRSMLPEGSQSSTAEVEQELLELWSSVEKERDATRETKLLAHQQALARKASRVSRYFCLS